MARKVVLLLLIVLVVALTMGLAGARACPPESKNPGGTPPNCGHAPAEQQAGCPERGPVSGLVRTTVEPIDPTGGHASSPSQGGLVHRANCTVVDDLLGL